MELAYDTLKRSQDRSKEYAEEVAKLRGELEKERATHAHAKIQFEVGLAQAKIQQTEAWKALEEERRLCEESALSEKALFEAALEEKGLRCDNPPFLCYSL